MVRTSLRILAGSRLDWSIGFGIWCLATQGALSANVHCELQEVCMFVGRKEVKLTTLFVFTSYRYHTQLFVCELNLCCV